MSIRQVSCAVRGAVCAALGVGLLGAQQAPVRPGIASALDRYAAGEFERAVEGRPFDGMTAEAVIGALDAWVGSLDSASATPDDRRDHTRRARIAARFAIDVTANRDITWMTVGVPLRDGAVPVGVFRFSGNLPSPLFQYQDFNAPMVAWACARVPKDGPVEPWEQGWWLASIALLQEAGEWGVLQGNQQVRTSGIPPPWRLAVLTEAVKGHLAEARARLGPLPRIRLAEAVARASSLTDATDRFTIGADGPRVAGRFDVLRVLEDAARSINSGQFARAERAFEALLSDSEFEAEVSLRIAQLRLLRRDWPAAQRWIDRAAGATSDHILLAAADYFRGWIFERTDRAPEALAAYRAAHARYDLSPNLNTLLAAQLMVAGERTEAAAVLERTMRDQHNHLWRDLWMLLVEGDARRAPMYVRQMRRPQ